MAALELDFLPLGDNPVVLAPPPDLLELVLGVASDLVAEVRFTLRGGAASRTGVPLEIQHDRVEYEDSATGATEGLPLE